MNPYLSLRRLAVAVSVALPLTSAYAVDNPNFAQGDLVLFFLQNGGTQTIYADLGPAVNFRGSQTGVTGASNVLDIVNVGAALATTYNSTPWQDDTTVFAGLGGAFSDSTGTTSQTNGDPGRTLYVSKPRTAVGTVGSPNSTLGSFTNASMTITATDIITQNNVLDTQYLTQVAVSPNTTSLIDDLNLINLAGNASTSFNSISGGVHQKGQATNFGTFGPVSNVEFMLDLYRVQAVSTATFPSNQVGFGDTAINRRGTYEGTIVVDSSGKVSFVVSSGASSNYDTWADANTLVGPDRDGDADVEKDGIPNGVEFVIGGNPRAATEAGKLPTVERSGGNFIFRFRRTDVSTYLNPFVQHDTDLIAPWTTAVNGVGGVVITEENDFHGVGTDRVTVTIPSTGDENFARLVVPDPN